MTIRWSAAWIGDQSATVEIELSTHGAQGPWLSLATGIPDSGHWQWTVEGVPTDQAHFRFTLTQGAAQVQALSRPFQLLPRVPTNVCNGDGPGNGIPRRLVILDNPVSSEARFRLVGSPLGIYQNQTDISTWEVTIHTVDGGLVQRLKGTGNSLQWNLQDQRGRLVPAGVYLVRLIQGNKPGGVLFQRLVVLR